MLEGGETKKLSYSIEPATALYDSITFLSDDENIATVNENGYVTGIGKGTTSITLTVTSKSKTLTASCSVNVLSEYKVRKTKLQYTYDDYTNYNQYNIDSCPSIGNPKLLVIPVWFTDSKMFISSSMKENVRQDIQKAYFGSALDTGWNSVSTYYSKLSKNRVSISGAVSQWYECGYSYSDITDSTKTTSLVKAATNWYFKNNPSESRKTYDSNSDGFLDGVMLIYGAADYRTYYSINKKDIKNGNLWAYCYWEQKNVGNKTSPNVNVYFWASYDFMYDSATSFLRTGFKYGGGDNSHTKIDGHTYIHEMGHVFGLDDYYDYSNYEYSPAGGFSMQDCNVGSHDPYSTMALGWAEPYIPVSECTIKLKPFQSSNEVILLSSNFNSDYSPFDEYLLLEYYTPDGLNELDSNYPYVEKYPQGSKQSGIRLWHVDARLTRLSSSYSDYYSTSLFSNPTKGNVTHAFSNSANSEYGSVLGSQYYSYNLLELIRNDTNETYNSTTNFDDNALFKKNDVFSTSLFSSQFVKRNKMNNGLKLGWSFTISDLNSEEATITITKN